MFLPVVHRLQTLKMDFPDPEEEFEMMYADELEVMRETEGRGQHCSVTVLQCIHMRRVLLSC
jgi:hypothetical protein